MLIREAELDGRARVDVWIEGARIRAVGHRLPVPKSVKVHEARGGALLPGLHDHHTHLFALAAAEASIPCGPPETRDRSELEAALREAGRSGSGWLRGVGYHESVAGSLDRARLDAWVSDRPLRIQHRSGSMWMLNSRALDELLDATPPPAGLERDPLGRPTGRLFRGDAWLHERLRSAPPRLEPLGLRLAALGITGVTDATADTDRERFETLAELVAAGALPQTLRVMGNDSVTGPDRPRATVGARKFLLDEPRLPDLADFCAAAGRAHAAGRNVAVHCVTRAELVFCLAGLREVGIEAGDRVEHAAVAPPELVDAVADAGLVVVTQPHFVSERGDQYRAEVEAPDLPWLYRLRAWHHAGVPLAAGSDAPFGHPDPWRSMRAAVSRRTPEGVGLGPSERLSAEAALALFTSPLEDPGGSPRRVAVGAEADLCLLDRPWAEARERLESGDVAATWCAGRRVFFRGSQAAG